MFYGLFNSIFVMDWKAPFISYIFALILHPAWLTELLPPNQIDIQSSVLSWKPSGRGNNVTYTVEYGTFPVKEWHYLCGCVEIQYNFTASPDDFYGKIFRIRAEQANETSVWIQSEQVQCYHIAVCAPLLNVTIKQDKVHLWMDHRDSSLNDHYGTHINFVVLYWKVASIHIQKQSSTPFGKTMSMEDLESRKEYCFQAVYRHYNKPYGKPSHVICKVIPETSAEKNLRRIILSLLLVGGMVIFGGCLYFAYKNYKRIKTFLQPPLDIPEHFQEFFSGEFSQHELIRSCSQNMESDFALAEIKEENVAEAI